MLVSRVLIPPMLELAITPPPAVGPFSLTGTGPRAARDDHTHLGLGSFAVNPPPEVGLGAVGVSTLPAREDHTHQGLGRLVYPGQDIQAAIDAAFADGGGVVTLMPGTHSPALPIYAKNNVSMRGITAHPFLTVLRGVLILDSLAGFMGLEGFTVYGVTVTGLMGGVGTAFMFHRNMAYVGNILYAVIPGFPAFTKVPGFILTQTGYQQEFDSCFIQGDLDIGFSGDVQVKANFRDCTFESNAVDPLAVRYGSDWVNDSLFDRCTFRGAVEAKAAAPPRTLVFHDCTWTPATNQTHMLRGNTDSTFRLSRARLRNFSTPPYVTNNTKVIVDDYIGTHAGISGTGSFQSGPATYREMLTITKTDVTNTLTLTLTDILADLIYCVGDGVSNFSVLLPKVIDVPNGKRIVFLNGQGGMTMTMVPNGTDTIRNSNTNLVIDAVMDKLYGVELQTNGGADWAVIALRGPTP